MSQVKKNGVMKESWWVMSQIKKKMVSWRSHNESCHKSKKKWCLEWVIMSRVTNPKKKNRVMNESWWVMSQVKNKNESCHKLYHEWVMLHLWMSHVAPVKEWRLTCKCVMSHVRMRHVAHTNESSYTHKWVTQYIFTSHVASTKVWEQSAVDVAVCYGVLQ